MINTRIFVSNHLGYTERLPVRMGILILAGSYHHFDCPLVDLRPVALGIIKGNGCNLIKPFRHRGRFSADSDCESWTDHIMQIGGAILTEAGIFYAVCAFRETVVFPDEAFMVMVDYSFHTPIPSLSRMERSSLL